MYSLQTFLLCLLSTNLLAAVQKAEKKLWQKVPQAEKKLWQEVPQASQEAKLGEGFASGVDYPNRDMGGYSAGTDYQNGGMGNYGNNYDANMNNNGYSGDAHGGGGYSSVSYSESFSGPSDSYSGAQEGFSNPGDGYSGHSDSFSGGHHGDGFGGDLRNGGWEKPVKTVVKHTIKNIAVPHHIPAPVSVPVPRYIKYFKPFAIAKPVGVPHVINVIKHIQKPIPFFTALPIQQTVPVPKFVGLPVQVRVPRPVFIHVPKIVPVAKRVPVRVEVNIPKPYIVPIYKHVPVPVPHRVPKVINIIKEVPHYVKKPVPVYVDDQGSIDYAGGGTSFSSGYSNNYGNDYQGGGYGNGGNSYGDPHGSSHQGNSYNNLDMGYNSNNGGSDYNQYQNYGNSQESNQYNSPYLKGHNQNSQKIYPANSYPRAHRLPNKSQPTKMKATEYSQIDGASASNNQGSSYELSVEVKHNGVTGNSPSYNKNVQASNQLQTGTANENYYQNLNNLNKPFGNIGSTHPSTAFDSLTSAQNVASGYSPPFSQPVYNPSSYADYAVNQQQQQQSNENYQQNNSQVQYSQPSYSETPTTQPTTTNTGMLTESSKSFSNYQQYPSNSYGNGYSENQQSNNFNSIPYGNQFSNYNNAKSNYPSKQNYEFTSFFKRPVTYQQPQTSVWESNSNFNNNKYASPEQQNQLSAFSQQSSKGNFGFNKDLSEYGNNPTKNNYNNFQNGYQSSNYPTGNTQNNNYNAYDNYAPSGASFSSNSYSNSYSQPSNTFQNVKNNNNAYKDNEKYDQSSTQNSYSSSNVAAPGVYSPSGTSYSSVSSYSNEYIGNQGVSPHETRQVTSSLVVNNNPDPQNTLKSNSMNLSNGYSNYQAFSQKPHNVYETSHANGGVSSQTFTMNNPASYSNNQPNYLNHPSYSVQDNKQVLGMNTDNTGHLNYQNSGSFSSQENNPGMSASNSAASDHSGYLGSLAYSPQDNKQGIDNSDISGIKSSENGGNQMLQDSLAALVTSASTNQNSYSHPATPSSTYSSNSYSNNNPYTMPSQNNYQSDLFSAISQLYNSNASQDSAFNNNQPIITAADLSTPYSYSQQVNEQAAPAYTGSTTYSNPYATNDEKYSQFSQPQVSQFLPQNPLQISSDLQNTGTNQESSALNQQTDSQSLSSSTSKPFQGFSTKLDEMEQHMDSMQSSGSSIINVYTNSPDSKEAKKGQTFTFIDPLSLESSHSSKYYTPPEPTSDKKSKYSNSDLQIVQAPSFKSDPNEPLQTSLDAYVPAQPVYYPPSSDQNTVYKEAMSVADAVYKEAVSLDSNSKEKTR